MNVTIIELSQLETSSIQMNKRPREDRCDDAALLPLAKKPHTDFSDLLGLTGEDKEQNNEQEGEDESTKERVHQQQTGMKSSFPHSKIHRENRPKSYTTFTTEDVKI